MDNGFFVMNGPAGGIPGGLKEAAGIIREYIESVFENYTGEDIKL